MQFEVACGGDSDGQERQRWWLGWHAVVVVARAMARVVVVTVCGDGGDVVAVMACGGEGVRR